MARWPKHKGGFQTMTPEKLRKVSADGGKGIHGGCPNVKPKRKPVLNRWPRGD